MNTDKKIEILRELMKENNIDALIIADMDPHQSEFVAQYWKTRQWLTGFSGSFGTAVITYEHAGLWTDFRYYVQASQQIANTQFKLYKAGKQKVPSVIDWLVDKLNYRSVIGIDGKIFSISQVKKYEKKLKSKNIFLNTKIDFIYKLWTTRECLPISKAFDLPIKYAGTSRKANFVKIRKAMKKLGANFHLMTSLDDIAWTLNLRGKDIHTNPVNICFLLISLKKVFLFINKEKIGKQLEKTLAKDGTKLFEYNEIYSFLSKIKTTILLDPEKTSFALYKSINQTSKIINKKSPAVCFKAIKNSIQIKHIRQTAIKDGVALISFLYWLENQNKQITEIKAAKKICKLRKKQDLFFDNSFDPIVAYKEHSAICHYSVTKKTNSIIKDKGIFLIDSGGHYFTGTTDITRTICMGEPSKQQKTDYTLILKGHINLALALFPYGTKGFQIDTLARQYLWKKGIDFGHGTGHGVGFFLSVHEGPASISPRLIDVLLDRGMVLTNEPGIYRENNYGIRLENMVLVKNAFENEFGRFLKFETLTYCHFEKDLIDKFMLSLEQINWLNDYHSMVKKKLFPYLDKDKKAWLRQKTMPL